ncbi:ScbA/BarX family gamma-butyrolactone biosynthesis protein [Streptomyces sp. RerS4]|uniref:ScbA/BarX family gamma-butyrolactone biosynthesis protein n=1 Tax=Streptomyces sp. RerS4 TaxID=2942449 RepID=UPI00201C798D|nr:ScbA/BarX family gamma-butyrolactone biosynthesis protein [Streptomyces sp. RerS4]UQX05351.1 transcriptional regulator [Streptomyces sp. RerS4]
MLISTERPAPVRSALTTTVAKEYVHRAALSDVFLTGCTSTGPDAFTIDAQWPRCHGFYVCDRGLYDPMLLCETIRQTLPLLTHTAYGVPFGHQLSWSRLRYAVNPHAMRVERTPAELQLHVNCTNITYRRGLPVALSMHYEITRGETLLAVASTVFHCHAPAVYQRLRAGRAGTSGFWAMPDPTPALSPALCRRDRPDDVVLSPTADADRWRLRVDPTHPVLFDHPVDHVPGMMLLEAARQAAHASAPEGGAWWPASMNITFRRYVEFTSPCWITAEPVPPQTEGRDKGLRVTAVQDEAPVFEATVAVAHIP